MEKSKKYYFVSQLPLGYWFRSVRPKYHPLPGPNKRHPEVWELNLTPVASEAGAFLCSSGCLYHYGIVDAEILYSLVVVQNGAWRCALTPTIWCHPIKIMHWISTKVLSCLLKRHLRNYTENNLWSIVNIMVASQ